MVLFELLRSNQGGACEMPSLKSLSPAPLAYSLYTKLLAYAGLDRQLGHESGRCLTIQHAICSQHAATEQSKALECCCCLSLVGSKGPMQLLNQATGRQGQNHQLHIPGITYSTYRNPVWKPIPPRLGISQKHILAVPGPKHPDG
jgi:hypothetical protein